MDNELWYILGIITFITSAHIWGFQFQNRNNGGNLSQDRENIVTKKWTFLGSKAQLGFNQAVPYAPVLRKTRYYIRKLKKECTNAGKPTLSV